MDDEIGEIERKKEEARQEKYLTEIRTRAKSARYRMWAREFAAQAIWLIVISAGGAIPLNAALGGPSWIEPSLGFVVVAAAGIERIFARTGGKAAAIDVLRRDLEQLQRRLEATASRPYSKARFEQFVEDCECLVSTHNRDVIEQNRWLFSS
jgi:hypothetical protein